VGIGGDGKGSFNLSSMASLAAAACGQKVAKHGNRAVSSFCGSADFFGELGYPLAIPPRQAEHLLADTGFVFLYAPTYHSAMKHAAAARRELAIRTLMNLLGPLANPSRAGFQLLGVPEDSMLKPLADAAMLLGGKRVMTIHSEDGLDEFSCAGATHCLLREAGGETREFVFQPSEVGIRGRDSAVLKGGTAEVNAAIALDLMQGRETGGMLEAACLNAGAGLFVAGATPDIASGYHKVRQAFAAGQVGKYFTSVITRSQELAAVPA
ncbi:MAG: anthranilate phosphoribosyltransferase, partial [Planctomycetota bacterium]|nr:anthranilate phosphoribosyltransferase [Planctomycetota bacterium]